jgi:hypothetical protein
MGEERERIEVVRLSGEGSGRRNPRSGGGRETKEMWEL